MGQVAHAGLAELVARFHLDTFVETGTGWGQSVRDALEVPALSMIYTIEIDHETWERNYHLFRLEPRVRCIHGESTHIVSYLAHRVLKPEQRVCWYLDAHFPGTGRKFPTHMLPLQGDAAAVVPVVGEVLEMLVYREIAHDVIILDDRCLWEADAYEGGPNIGMELRTALHRNDVVAIEGILLRTHECERTTRDAGYAIFTPRA